MKFRAGVVILLIALLATAFPVGATELPEQPGWWTGYNEAIDYYYVRPGYPKYSTHARYIGELSGTWYEMGLQYGQRAGDLVRLVFEGYYDDIYNTIRNEDKIVTDARRFGQYLSQILPEAVEFMRGIADGSSSEFAKSTYAHIGTDMDKVLIINHYFALRRVTGTQHTWPGTVAIAEPSLAYVPGEETLPACTGVVVIGGLDGPTKDRTTIHGGTKDQQFFPQLYQVTYTTNPSDPNANRIWTISSAGEIGGQMAGNDKGVIVSGYAGGNAKGLWSYGLEWNIGDWYAACFADTAEEAANILTLGRPGYIEATGSKMIQPAWGINWLISDLRDARCVEIVPGRFAVRKPGDMGEDRFLICTNHCVATWSIDENLERTDVPMTEFGDESGTFSGLSVSGTRYWTQWWNVKYNYGNIDRNMVMQWYANHYYIDKNGVRVDYVWDDTYGWVSSNQKTTVPCRHRAIPNDHLGNTTDAKVGVAQDLAFYFTVGRPCEWVGPWDVQSLKYTK